MALYSQRFWGKLGVLDGRLNAALQQQRDAYVRLATARQAIIGVALVEFQFELRERSEAACGAVTVLQRFCCSRSNG